VSDTNFWGMLLSFISMVVLYQLEGIRRALETRNNKEKP